VTTREAAAIYERLGQPVPAALAEAKASKYRNVKKECDGILFDSALEARAYRILKLWERAGQISALGRQQRFTLQDGYRGSNNIPARRPIYYVADFTFYDEREKRDRVVDVKGFRTEVFKLKAKLFAARYPLLTLELWTKSQIAAMERGK
jgi:hypothetical protein